MLLITIIVSFFTFLVLFLVCVHKKESFKTLIERWVKNSYKKENDVLDEEIKKLNETVEEYRAQIQNLEAIQVNLTKQIRIKEMQYKTSINNEKETMNQYINYHLKLKLKNQKIEQINEIFKTIAKKLHKNKDLVQLLK